MAQKRKSLKKSFRKSNRSTRRKSKTNKRKSRKIRGGGWFGESKGTTNTNKQLYTDIVNFFRNKQAFNNPNLTVNLLDEDKNYIKEKINKLIDALNNCSNNPGSNCSRSTKAHLFSVGNLLENLKIYDDIKTNYKNPETKVPITEKGYILYRITQARAD